MTYVKLVSEKIEKVITTHTDNTTQLAYKNNKCLRNVFTKLKDPVPLQKRTNIIYKIPCLGNGTFCGKSYVGQTKQYLQNRLKNHKRDLKCVYDPAIPKTALVDHFHELDHYPDFKSVSILGTQRNLSKRLTSEALHIYTENTYNIKRDTDHITAVFSNIIENTTTHTSQKRLHPKTALSPSSTHVNKRRKLN